MGTHTDIYEIFWSDLSKEVREDILQYTEERGYSEVVWDEVIDCAIPVAHIRIPPQEK